MLVIARILQGTRAAVVWTVGLAMVLDTVGPESLVKVIGTVRAALCSRKITKLTTFRDLLVHIRWWIDSSSPWRSTLPEDRLWRSVCFGLNTTRH